MWQGEKPHVLAGMRRGQREIPRIAENPASRSHILSRFALCKTHEELSGGQWGPLYPQTCYRRSAIFPPTPSMCFQPERPSPGSPRVTRGDVTEATEDPKSPFLERGWGVFVDQVLAAGRGCRDKTLAVQKPGWKASSLKEKPGTASWGGGRKAKISLN